MVFTAVVYEDNIPIRAFRDNACIFNAYKWCHKHYNLYETENLAAHQLPDWLRVDFLLLTEEQFANIVK
jgi:hypothetical protein